MEFGLESLEATDSPVQPSVIVRQSQSMAAIAFAARVAIRRESDSRVQQSQKLRSKPRIEDPTEPESSRLGQYKLREDDLIKPTKPGSLPGGPVQSLPNMYESYC